MAAFFVRRFLVELPTGGIQVLAHPMKPRGDEGMTIEQLKPDKMLRGPIFPEPVQIIVVVPMGDAVKLIAKGLNTSRVYEPILTPENSPHSKPRRTPNRLTATRCDSASPSRPCGSHWRMNTTPIFRFPSRALTRCRTSLKRSIDYFIRLPRIRFLLADDPGAGKTIMAGLLIKELKIRGLIKRTLIVTPANLSFQWQREMKDKFRENFEIIRSDVLRANYGSNPWQDKNQVITSVSWVSRIEDAKESLLRSHWDLIIVDEATR